MKYMLLAVFLLQCRPGNPGGGFHIINLSLPRTATTSFAGIFENHGATHEFMLASTLQALMDFREKKIPLDALRKFMLQREGAARHKVDSASFYFLAPEAVIEIFPDAKFFLSVRRCEPWITSMVDNSVFAHKMIREGMAQGDLSFLDRYSEIFISHHSHDTMSDPRKIAADADHIVNDLARFWGLNNIRLLEAIRRVSAENRLVIRTEEFSGSVSRFAALAGVPEASLKTSNLHLNKDRDMNYFRGILGEKRLAAACAKEEKKMSSWLNANKNILEPVL